MNVIKSTIIGMFSVIVAVIIIIHPFYIAYLLHPTETINGGILIYIAEFILIYMFIMFYKIGKEIRDNLK